MNQKKILIVEDEFITAREIQIRLKNLGYQIAAVASFGEQAIEMAKLYAPDLILMDINLGTGIDGIEAARLIRQTKPIPIVYLTAYTDAETFKRAQITEPFGFLIKPINEREMNIVLEIALYKFNIENKLREVIATRDYLFSILAHDLKTPFFNLKALAVLMTEYSKDAGEETKAFIKDIQRSADGSLQTLENLMQWANLQRHRIQVKAEDTNMKALIDESIKLFTVSAEQKEISIQNNVNHSIIVHADRSMVETIIRNLLGNAIKYCHKKGSILFSNAEPSNGLVAISIQDNGIGLTLDLQRTLFQSSQNQSRFGTVGEKGTGLGLALCKEFSELNGGKIEVNSLVDQGSTFTFTLPTI